MVLAAQALSYGKHKRYLIAVARGFLLFLFAHNGIVAVLHSRPSPPKFRRVCFSVEHIYVDYGSDGAELLFGTDTAHFVSAGSVCRSHCFVTAVSGRVC